MTRFSETVTPDTISRAAFVQIATGMSGSDLKNSIWQLYALDSNGNVWTFVDPEDGQAGWQQMPMTRLPNA